MKQDKRMRFKVKVNDMPLYGVWCIMKQRCSNPIMRTYYRYGGRGIKVCPSWQKFMPFYKWAMRHGWKKGLEIDRKNNNGNYSPKNCRIVTHNQNCQVKNNSVLITYDNKTLNISQWTRELGLSLYQVRKKFNIKKNKK